MPIPGNLLTTAMAVMPHTDVTRALKAALSLDIPFWPQLPLLSYYEDMYVQAAEHFPGIVLDLDRRRLGFSIEKFYAEYESFLARESEPNYLDVSPAYSAVYPRFLALDLKERPAIRGQLEGPISFGFNVRDQDDRPVIFNDEVRPFMLEFMAKRVNVQLARLKKMNPNAFMFVDEPGLQFLFSALAGYTDVAARSDLEKFFGMIERPRGVHLCGNPDWDFLLNLALDVLSLDVYANAEVFATYAPAIKRFLDRGGVIVWGIVPTNFEPFSRENQDSLKSRLHELWAVLQQKGIERGQILAQSLLSPATCCLVNQDREKTVEAAFQIIKALSQTMRREEGLP